MSFINRKGLLDVVSILNQARRFKGKINIQKPRAPHYEKALLLKTTKPYFIKPEVIRVKDLMCGHETKKFDHGRDIENPLQKIYSRELLDRFKTSKVIAFYHKNPISAEVEFNAYAAFHKIDMEYKIYGKKTLEMAIKNTPYEVILDFYISQNAIVFSKEADIKKMLKVNKKFPQLIFLAAIYENRFISKDQFLQLANIPNIQVARAELVQTLQGVGSQLVSHLGTNQQMLVSQLSERSKQLQEKEEK